MKRTREIPVEMDQGPLILPPVERWEEHFRELQAYRKRFGHCHVPAKWKQNPTLAKWVDHQRYFYRHRRLSVERTQRLQAIGFEWHGALTDWRVDAAWARRCRELVQFKKRFGHCRVPKQWPGGLLTWLTKQRVALREGHLPAVRLRQLQRLGLSLGSANVVGQRRWENRLAELARYRQRFGDCNVPARWPKNPTLAKWVDHQRHFRRKNELSGERVAALNALGFRWRADSSR